MGVTVYPGLLWESCVDAEVPVHTKKRLDALLPEPLRRFIKAPRDPWEHLAHNPLDPSAMGGIRGYLRGRFWAYVILIMAGVFMNNLTFSKLSR